MGKHDKTEMVTASIMPNEWYEARIKTLERENLDLHKEMQAVEYGAEMKDGIINELRSEIDELRAQNERLRDAIIREVTR